jgi:hypothetical protein
MPGRLVAAAVVVIVLAAVAVLLLQQGGGSSGPLSALAEAAEKTEQEPGGHAAVHGIVTAPDGTKIVMTGTMVFDDAGHIAGALSFPNPKTSGRVTMRMIGDGSAMYMSSSTFGSLPGGAKWMGLDFADGEVPATPVPTSSDPTEGLKLLDSVDDVEELGKEDVRGVPTTHYRGTTGTGKKPPRVEAWIDGDGRVIQMRIVNSPSSDGGKQSALIDMRTDFYGFGPVPPIKVPDSSEVFDATALGES